MTKSVLKPRILWLQTLEEPYRTQAIENSSSRVLKQGVSNIQDALLTGFLWADSPQKRLYWEEFYNTITNVKQKS